jgi:hypothetical protein
MVKLIAKIESRFENWEINKEYKFLKTVINAKLDKNSNYKSKNMESK